MYSSIIIVNIYIIQYISARSFKFKTISSVAITMYVVYYILFSIKICKQSTKIIVKKLSIVDCIIFTQITKIYTIPSIVVWKWIIYYIIFTCVQYIDTMLSIDISLCISDRVVLRQRRQSNTIFVCIKDFSITYSIVVGRITTSFW